MPRLSPTAAAILATAPPLPLGVAHWKRVVQAIGLSKRQAEVADLMLRDLCDRQIADVLGINKSTAHTHNANTLKATS